MKYHALLPALLLAFSSALFVAPQSQAAINASNLGAKYDGTKSNITFKIYSSRATRIELSVYASAYGQQELAKYVLTKDVNQVWSTTVAVSALQAAGVTGAVYYGYHAWGPNWTYSASWTKGSSVGFIKSIGTKPTRALKDDIVYEVHVRGLTMSDTSIAAAYRGTYKGAGLKAAALKAMGVTAVEFLPVQETQNDTNDVVATNNTGDNYWGYMTLNYFAPDRRYAYNKAAGGPTIEFKEMVKAFHDQGIKVMIDVVYNHTGEGGSWGGTDGLTVYNLYNFRGLDNPVYYELTSDKQYSWDNTGVGGNYNTHNTIAQNLIVDSLAYWKNTLGVDGFRFDLASVLGNTCESGCFNFDKMDSANALNRITRELPPRPAAGGSGVDLVAEPWAIGGNSYQVGGFPSGWSEWNGSYRDIFRQDQNKMGSVAITPGQLASRFAGSSDLYQDDGRQPWNSVNFIVAHDGFTLKDLYSCNSKSNAQAWPYGPSDGGDDNNNSWDQGGVAQDQRKAARNGMAFLMLSAGTPMITGGDEFLRSINCNNNPYNLDSSANWLNYTLSTDQSNFKTFASRLMAFRNAHPALRPVNFYSSSDTNGNVMEQLRWFKPDGSVIDSAYFNDANSHAMAYRIDGSEFGDTASAIYVAYNGWSGAVNFTLPWPGTGKTWYRVMDTSNWNEGANTVVAPGSEALIGGENTVYGLNGRAMLLLIAK
ncbi:MAG: glycogen-debranching protein [Burkholderiales bacterium]|nr:glycogen-debranching protein [Burkholderiales bacterium]